MIKNIPKVSSHSVVDDGSKVSPNCDQQHPLISSILVQRHHTPLLATGEIVRDSKKRKDTSDVQPPPSKSFKPGTTLDQTLIKRGVSLTNKKRQDLQTKHLLKVDTVSTKTSASDVPNTVSKTPVVTDTVSLSAAKAQKSRRKGTPTHKRLLRSSSAIGE